MASGRGLTPGQALASCLGEAAELASACFHGTEELVRASWREVAGEAIHPSSLVVASEHQYRTRDKWNAASGAIDWMPARFDEASASDWVRAVSPDGTDAALVPAAWVYVGYFEPGDERAFAVGDSSGCAAGETIEDATVGAFLELVERDATAIWWYGRHCRPAFDPGAVRGAEKLVAALDRRARRSWLLDLTTDLGIPVCAAVSAGADGRAVAVGTAAHFDPRRAALSALTEMLQAEFTLSVRLRIAPLDQGDPVGAWLLNASLRSMRHLLPSGSAPLPRRRARNGGVEACLDLCRKAGLRFLAVDLTRPQIGVPVVRAVVPGLRPVRRRLAPGRLYDVPARLGWRDRPLTARQMNRVPMTA